MMNLIIRNCSLAKIQYDDFGRNLVDPDDIIKIQECAPNSENLLIKMQNISFIRNTNSFAIGVSSSSRKCYALVLKDVFFLANRGGASFGYKNDITRLQMIRNRRFPLYLYGETKIKQLNATENKEGNILVFTDGKFSLQDSLLDENECGESAILYGYSSKMRIKNSRFLTNKCDEDLIAGDVYQGGVLYSSNCRVDIFNSSFINNSTVEGGAIYTTGEKNLKLKGVLLDGNRAKREGAVAIVLTQGSINSGVVDDFHFMKTKFTNNKASLYGGAIFVLSRTNIMEFRTENSSFFHNTALRGGKMR